MACEDRAKKKKEISSNKLRMGWLDNPILPFIARENFKIKLFVMPLNNLYPCGVLLSFSLYVYSVNFGI